MKRPALYACLLLFPGLVAADRTDLPPAALFGIPAGFAACLVLVGKRGHAAAALAPALVASLGLARTEPPAPPDLPKGAVRFEARVIGAGPGAALRRVRVTAGPARGVTATLRPPRGGELPRGGVVAGRGRFVPPPGPRNPGDPDFFRAERFRGTAALLDTEEIGVAAEGPLEEIRGAMIRRAERLGGREEGLFLALFLGRRDRLDPAMSAAFRETGLAHLLALSGLHIGVFYVVALAPLSLLPIPRRFLPALTVALLWLFGWLAGFPVSLFRALGIATLYAAGRLLERPVDRWNALGAAALAVVAADGGAPWDVSFRLSFAAVAGIAAALPLARRLSRHRRARLVLVPLLLGFSAQAATAPVVLHHFRAFAPVGAPLTVIASPVTALAVAAGSAWTILGPIHPALDETFENAAWGSFALLGALVDRARTFAPGRIHVREARADAVALALLVVAASLAMPGRRRAAPLLLLPLAALPLREPLPLRVTVLDVGQGSAALAELPGGETILFDTGPRTPEWDAGSRVLLPFLERRGARPVDLALVSHADADHMGGAVALLEAGAVRRLVDGGEERQGAVYEAYDSVAFAAGVGRASLRTGARFRFSKGVTVDVLFAPEGDRSAKGTNDASVVALLRYGRFTMLFPGDATPRTERFLLRRGAARRVGVLVAPHHGARHGLIPPFLRRARPRAAVISAGEGNRYGHPHDALLRRLDAAGCPVFRTDREGGVTIRTDGRRVAIEAARSGACLAADLPARPPGPFP